MDKLIIAVDFGHLRAFRVKEEPLGRGKVELIESYDSLETHGRVNEKLSDQAGRFRLSGGKGSAAKAKGYGEPHNVKLEAEKRLTKLIAKEIGCILSRETSYEAWYFAAPDEINGRILEHIDPEAKTRLGKNVLANLTNSKKSDVLKYFE